MTRTLIFPGEEALRLSLGSIIPAEVAVESAQVWRDADGQVRVLPAATLTKTVLGALEKAGVAVEKAASAPAEALTVSCWAEAVLLRRTAEPAALTGPVLFLLPDGQSMIQLAGEMLRLGCDRQSFRVLDDGRVLLRAVGPPYYTLTRALDHLAGLSAFSEVRPNVWIELGHTHPLAHLMRPTAEVVLLPGRGPWLYVGEGAFTDLYEVVDLTIATRAQVRSPTTPSLPRLAVPLLLRRTGRRALASLWVLRQDGVAKLEALVRSLPEDLLSRLSFAAGSLAGDGDIVVLRARPHPKGPPDLPLDAETYAPVGGLANLFAPVASSLEPPVRRDRLRALLCPDAEALTWLRPLDDGGFVPETLGERSFLPLEEWVDYVCHREAALIAPWSKSALFAFDDFIAVAELAPTRGEREAPEAPDEPEKPSWRKKKTVEKAEPKGKKGARASEPAPAPVAATPSASLARSAPGELEKQLAALEQRFLALDAAQDDPERQAQWREMAELHAALAHRRDAGVCMARASWEQHGEAAQPVAAAWLAIESKPVGGGDLEATLLERTAPSRDEVRALAASVYARGLHNQRRGNEAAVQRWLDKFDAGIDLRSLWLGRWGLSVLLGGDRLGLARVRDRLLAELGRGLSVERDLPTFLRFVGGGSDRDATATRELTLALEELLNRYERTKRARSPIEAPEPMTRAYVHLLFAYGFARLGSSDRARALAAPTASALKLDDAVHGFLHRAYSARVEQALAGLPPGSPLPPEIAGELNGLERFLRYKVDRLREASQVLEPQERLDPFRGFQRGDGDPRGAELAALRGMTDEGERASAIERLYARALDGTPVVDEKADMLDGLMDFFPLIPEAHAVAYLRRLLRHIDDVPGPRRAELLEEALALAAHFARLDLVDEIMAPLQQVLDGLDDEEIGRMARTVRGALKTLRRAGRRNEAQRLITTITGRPHLPGVGALEGRLHLASALAYLGHLDTVKPILDEARGMLHKSDLKMPERVKLARAMAGALGQLPRAEALAALGQLADELAKITDQYNTNSHFCLSVIAFMESLVQAVASDDLALGAEGRLFLDEDEYLVRRRVHRDLEELSR